MRQHASYEAGARRSQNVPGERAGDVVVGIDTGGTFTDGVLLDYHSRRVLASGKTLTTRDDLTTGIITILETLHIPEPSAVKLVGISSTLATNSIAEGKAREVGLLLIGYDTDLIQEFNLEHKFPTRHFAYFTGGHTSQGTEQAPLDLAGIRRWVTDHRDTVDAVAVSSFFSPLNPSHELRVLEEVHALCGLPVVMGHQLSTKLDSIRRATTACLNASLVAIMQEFIEAVRRSMHAQGIHAPLMIVKGDGSLMPYTEAMQKPVETVMSGPAASAIGGRFLSEHGSALVVDVGGTTTDLALIENNRMTITEDGARVGSVETAVKAARIRTAGLGCDSRIAVESSGAVSIGPERVIPLCRLAAFHEPVAREILTLAKKRRQDRRPTDVIYWRMAKPLEGNPLPAHDPRRDLLERLRERPCSVTDLLKTFNKHHPVQLNVAEPLRQGLIETATLTPTDLLHVGGQMTTWRADVARQAVAHVCGLLGTDSGRFVADTLERMVRSMAEECLVFLARRQPGIPLPENPDGTWGPWLVREALGGENPYLAVAINSRFPIIGIGAPAEIFVKRVAETLSAPFVLPSYAAVANAVGAVAGSVMVEKEALVYLQEVDETRAFIVQVGGGQTRFMEEEEAHAYARHTVHRLAQEGALTAGAVDPQVTLDTRVEGALRRVTARAVGNPRLSQQWGSAG